MRKTDQVREIFREIRRAVGVAVSAKDIIRLAHLIVKSYHTEEDDDSQQWSHLESREFLLLPVDEAMKDGGWKILMFETKARFDIELIDPVLMDVTYREIAKYLGPEWQNRFPPG